MRWSHVFENETFNLGVDNIEDIAIYKSRNGDRCFIADKKSKSHFYKDFIIYDGPKVKKRCTIDFSPSSTNGKFIPRLTFYKERKGEITVGKKKEKVIIEFAQSKNGLFEFWKLISFLKEYKTLIDVGDFDDKYQVVDNSKYIAEFNSKEELDKVEALKELDLSENIIEDYLSDTRSKTLDTFKLLLENQNEIDTYRSENNIQQQGDESVWHHFLKSNPWILGLGVRLVFISDFNDEVQVGIPDTKGSGSPKSDSLGISDYTVLVELKTSNTNIFTEHKTSKARAGTWSFTSDFIEGISQCLAQKTAWEKSHNDKNLISEDGDIVNQDKHRTIDPNVIFIIGNKQKEINLNNINSENIVKRDTFERFRRNNRNIDVITYDELYERAYYIIHHKLAPQLDLSQDIHPEDIPF